ncbi:unnamed protein product, partial [Vitis vinifera]
MDPAFPGHLLGAFFTSSLPDIVELFNVCHGIIGFWMETIASNSRSSMYNQRILGGHHPLIGSLGVLFVSIENDLGKHLWAGWYISKSTYLLLICRLFAALLFCNGCYKLGLIEFRSFTIFKIGRRNSCSISTSQFQGLCSSNVPCSVPSDMETAARPWIFPDRSSKAECLVCNMLSLLLRDPWKGKSPLPQSNALVWIGCFYLISNISLSTNLFSDMGGCKLHQDLQIKIGSKGHALFLGKQYLEYYKLLKYYELGIIFSLSLYLQRNSHLIFCITGLKLSSC